LKGKGKQHAHFAGGESDDSSGLGEDDRLFAHLTIADFESHDIMGKTLSPIVTAPLFNDSPFTTKPLLDRPVVDTPVVTHSCTPPVTFMLLVKCIQTQGSSMYGTKGRICQSVREQVLLGQEGEVSRQQIVTDHIKLSQPEGGRQKLVAAHIEEAKSREELLGCLIIPAELSPP
jgi:hypothetical protein